MKRNTPPKSKAESKRRKDNRQKVKSNWIPTPATHQNTLQSASALNTRITPHRGHPQYIAFLATFGIPALSPLFNPPNLVSYAPLVSSWAIPSIIYPVVTSFYPNSGFRLLRSQLHPLDPFAHPHCRLDSIRRRKALQIESRVRLV